MRKRLILIALLLLPLKMMVAQMPGGTPVTVSNVTQTLNGQCYYVHIVQRGQTVYQITKAYGLKEYDAVVKKDYQFLGIGDTVWLPCRTAQVSVVRQDNVSPDDTMSREQIRQRIRDSLHIQDTALVRPLRSPNRITVSLMMPLHLDQMEQISTTKFDVEQRGRQTYKSLEFIQFYEGIRLALNKLENMGISVTLNVVDVPDNNPETAQDLFLSHNVAQSDYLIALLTRVPFTRVAQLAKDSNLFIINPIANRSEILVENPYLFKCAPSDESKIATIVETVKRTMPGSHVLLIHSGTNSDKNLLQAATRILDEEKDINYSVIAWGTNSSKLKSDISSQKHTVVVSLYNVDPSRNRIFAGNLLNKLASFKNNPAVLFTLDDWTRQFTDIDYNQLQQLSYHTFYAGYDLDNENHVDFLQRFRDIYRTEPTENYAAIGHDIVAYFTVGLSQQGSSFWLHPHSPTLPKLLWPITFKQKNRTTGFENSSPQLYRLENYKFKAVMP